MKTFRFYSLLSILLIFASCTKEKTTVTEPDGDKTTVTKVGLDNQKIDSAKIKLNNNLDKAGNDLKKGAKEFKSDVKDATSKAAAAVENGARKVKEDTEK